MDFLVAVLVLTAVLGLLSQSLEFPQKNFPERVTAQALAESLDGGIPFSQPAYCVFYSNGTGGNCSSFSCGGTVSAARRLAVCADAGPCVKEVRACG